MNIREDDIELLLPTFRDRVKLLMETLRSGEHPRTKKPLRYDPVLFDGLRTPEEALRNAARGKGIVQSMHLYGCAADIICRQHLWSCSAKKCKFFTDLGVVAEHLGFVWGGRFTKVDQPHIQGVTVAQQKLVRELGTGEASAGERDALVRKHFKLD